MENEAMTNDNDSIRKVYESEGGPEIRHGENTDDSIPTADVLKGVLVFVLVVIVFLAVRL
jgi:hypothetical protein